MVSTSTSETVPPMASEIEFSNQHAQVVTTHPFCEALALDANEAKVDNGAPTSLDSNVKLMDNIEHEVTEKDLIPYVGMEFETEDHAYRFYNMYAGFIGFSVRKDWRNKSKLDKETVISQRFVCFKEGFKKNKDYEGKMTRKDIRTGCLAQMAIGRQSDRKYVVTSFVKDHNHELATPWSKHKLPSQRRISDAQATQVELANRSGIRQKLVFESISR